MDKKLIKRKTLSAVLGHEVENIHNDGGAIGFKYTKGKFDCISHGTMMRLCKEWALGLGWALSNGITDHITKIRFCTASNDCFNTHKTFNRDTEEEAVYRICKFIRKQNKK